MPWAMGVFRLPRHLVRRGGRDRQRGLAPVTVHNYCWNAEQFLAWLPSAATHVSELCIGRRGLEHGWRIACGRVACAAIRGDRKAAQSDEGVR